MYVAYCTCIICVSCSCWCAESRVREEASQTTPLTQYPKASLPGTTMDDALTHSSAAKTLLLLPQSLTPDHSVYYTLYSAS